MILRTLAAFALRRRSPVPAQAQQPAPRDPAFEQFLADLWKDAQAQGHHARDLRQGLRRRHARSARDRDHQEAAGIQQAGRRSTSTRSPRRRTPSRGCSKEAEWRTTFDAIEKKYQRRALGDPRHLGHGNVLRRVEGQMGRHPLAVDAWHSRNTAIRISATSFWSRSASSRTATSRARNSSAHGPARWARPSSCRRTSSTTPSTSTATASRDIWTSVPDVLASTANYFAKAAGGWKMGMPWGFEVIVPKGFDLMKSRATFDEWSKLGVRRADGKAFPGKRRRHPVFSGRPARARPSSSRRTSRSSRTTTTPTSTRSPSVTSPT